MTKRKRDARARRPEAPTPARVRARDVDKLVTEIARAMVDGLWSPLVANSLAERERVQLNTVDEWSAAAGRLLRIGHDVETYRARNLQRLDETYATGDGKVRVAAVAEQNKMLGLHVPQQLKVDVTVQTFAALDDASMLERVRAQRVELEELERRLEMKLGIVNVPALPARGDDGDE
jgi:hypothetical protein